MKRIGCCYCFRTLDPNDPDPNRRQFLRCTGVGCGAYYHDNSVCWKGSCVLAHCGCESTTKVRVEPQSSVSSKIRSVHPVFGGPVNTLDDIPLGLSTGMVGDFAPDPLVITNNSGGRMQLPTIFGPPWASLSWDPPSEFEPSGFSGPLNEWRMIEPGESRRLNVRFVEIRPFIARYVIRFGEQEMLLQTATRPQGWLLLGMIIFWLMLLTHIMSFGRGIALGGTVGWQAITFGLLASYMSLISPGWPRGAGLLLMERFDSLYPCTLSGPYVFLQTPDLPQRVLWAIFWGTAASFGHMVFIGFLSIRLLNALVGTWIGLGIACLIYCLLLLVFVSFWLAEYQIKPAVSVRTFLGSLFASVQNVRDPHDKGTSENGSQPLEQKHNTFKEPSVKSIFFERKTEPFERNPITYETIQSRILKNRSRPIKIAAGSAIAAILFAYYFRGDDSNVKSSENSQTEIVTTDKINNKKSSACIGSENDREYTNSCDVGPASVALQPSSTYKIANDRTLEVKKSQDDASNAISRSSKSNSGQLALMDSRLQNLGTVIEKHKLMVEQQNGEVAKLNESLDALKRSVEPVKGPSESTKSPARDEFNQPASFSRVSFASGSIFTGIIRDFYSEESYDATLQVQTKTDKEVTGLVFINTESGKAVQRFNGYVEDDKISLLVSYVSGPILYNPETWDARLTQKGILGKWRSDTRNGDFSFNLKYPEPE